MDFPLSFYVAGCVSTVMVGIAKAGFGGGVGIIAVPIMLLWKPDSVDAATVPAILLPVLCVCDLFAIGHYRNAWDRRNFALIMPGAVLGIAIGSIFLFGAVISDAAFQLGIGVLSLLFVADQFVRGWVLKRVAAFRPGLGLGTVFGAVAGFGSTLAHAGGPPVTMFLLPQPLDRRIFVGTTVFVFTAINAIKLVPYGLADRLDFTNLKMSLMLLPFVPVGVYLGLWMNRILSERVFRTIVYTILFLTAVKFVHDGIVELAS